MRIRLVYILFITFFTTALRAQDTIYVYNADESLKEKYIGQIDGNDTLRLGYYEYYVDNLLSQKGTYKHNKLEGELLVFHENGKAKFKYVFSEGKKNGEYRYYDEYGNVRQVGYYKDDMLEGRLESYAFNGMGEFITHFKNGKKEGIETQFKDGTGLVQSRIAYKGDTINGLYETFYEDGNLNYRGTRIKDNFIGDLLVFYNSGDTLRKCFYKNGAIDGNLYSYHENNRLKSITFYKNGMISGDYIEYFSDGSISTQGSYRYNRKVGAWSSYYPTGKPYSMGSFKDSKFDGLWTIYHENGNLKQVGKYHDGKAIGQWSYYHPNGNLWKRGTYVNDKEEGLWLFYEINGVHANVLFYNHKNMHPIGMFNVEGQWEKVYIKNGEITQIFTTKEIE